MKRANFLIYRNQFFNRMQETYVCLWKIERFVEEFTKWRSMEIIWIHLIWNVVFSIKREDLQSIAETSSRMVLGRKMAKYIYLFLRDSRFMDAIIRVSKNINASGIINLASFCFNSIRQRQRIDGREIYSLDPKTVLFTINQNLKKENAHTHTHTHIHTSHDETNHDQSNR